LTSDAEDDAVRFFSETDTRISVSDGESLLEHDALKHVDNHMINMIEVANHLPGNLKLENTILKIIYTLLVFTSQS